jgi:hypothetical protein
MSLFISAFNNNALEMIEILLEAGAKFNTTEKTDEHSMIPYSFINQFSTSYLFINSSILSSNEWISLTQMLNNQTEIKLIYRATRDSFAASSFHSKCDNISNTVTIIKTTSNSVFGGFTSATWKSSATYSYDVNAFIFSLRRSGNLNKERFNVTRPDFGIFSFYSFGPSFGTGSYFDLYVSDGSDANLNSYSNLGYSYQLPKNKNMTTGSVEAQSYLAGTYTWKTTEIEVYQVTPFIPYSVTFLHNGCLFFYFKNLFIYYNFFQSCLQQ